MSNHIPLFGHTLSELQTFCKAHGLPNFNAKQICDQAAAKGFGVPALNNNGGSYDIGRAIIEASQELDAPLIIQCYEPNLEYRGFDFAGKIIRELAADTTIPMAIALDHGSSPQTVLRAVRAGFTHVMIDYAHLSIEENIAGTNEVIKWVRPLGISVEAEIGHIILSSDASDKRAPTVSPEEVKQFVAGCDVDLLAVAVGTTHGIFKSQTGMDFKLIPKLKKISPVPLVQHGTCGIALKDITKLVKAGMTKVNFGEGLRMNYIKYYNELSQTLDHQGHTWRIDRAAKDLLKKDIKNIIRACGADGKAGLIK